MLRFLASVCYDHRIPGRPARTGGRHKPGGWPMNSRSVLPARAAAAIVLALSLAACGPDVQGVDTDADPVAGTDVAVVDNAFEPSVLQVDAGQTVTWTWEGDSPHDVALADVSSEIQRNGTYTRTFETAGEFEYRCTVHPRMSGAILVTTP